MILIDLDAKEPYLLDGRYVIEPPKRGYWIVRDNPGTGWYRITCSECGEDVTSEAPCIGFFPDVSVVWDYCPYCGSKMEVEK